MGRSRRREDRDREGHPRDAARRKVPHRRHRLARRRARERGGRAARHRRRPTAPTRSCWPIPRSRRSTIRCPTNCTCPGPRRRSRPASTCCARSRSRSTPQEAQRLIAAREASGKLVAEAFMVRHPPAMAARARDRALRRDRRGRRDPDPVHLSPARPRQRAQPAARRRRAVRHRLLRHPDRALRVRGRAVAGRGCADIDPAFGRTGWSARSSSFPAGGI